LTIGQFIRQLRLDCALDRLLQQKSIKETMYFVGYRHVGHFNALFKQKFGYLPSEIK
jgi:AraC-like DNA-binding protein